MSELVVCPNLLRCGHKSGRPQEGFDTDTDRLLPLVLIRQDDLIQQNRSQCQQLTSLQAFDRHLTTPFKDVLNTSSNGSITSDRNL